MPDYEIECRSLTKRFNDFTAVNEVSFGVLKGEIFGFLGPNGCGKSTTIRMICGILTPTSGKAFVRDLDVGVDPDRVKQGIGYMSQKFSLYDDLTVVENLQFFGGIYGLHGARRGARIAEVVRIADLEREGRALVGELSTGIRQRLALAASILHAPKILILDEPTSGVDPLSRRRFWDLIYDLAEQGATVLVTTHSMDEAEHCHRVAMMQSGRLVCTGAPEELRRTQIRARVFSIDCEPLFPALEALRSVREVADVSVLGSRVHVLVNPEMTDGVALGQVLQHAGITVRQIEPSQATLEDVFVSVAGEAVS